MNKNNRKYNNRLNSILPFLLVIASMIMGIGYATVNSVVMEISGTAFANIQKDVYISSAVVLKNGNELPTANINLFYKTVLNSIVTLDNTDPNSSISFQITIHNTTNDSYKFKGTEYMLGENTYSNENITFYLTGLNEGDILKKGDAITFNITFHYKDNAILDNNTLNSYLNFNFEKLNVYSITYNDIVNNNYPLSVYEGEDLEIVFFEPIPEDVVVTNVENFTYNDGILNINNALGNITIQSLDNIDFLVMGDEDIIDVNLDRINAYNSINIEDLFDLTLTGKNLTSKRIKKIDIIYTYTSKTGSKQSMTSTLTINTNSYTNLISLKGKYNGDVTSTFDGINIEANNTFTINHDINKITNGKIEITSITLRAYLY